MTKRLKKSFFAKTIILTTGITSIVFFSGLPASSQTVDTLGRDVVPYHKYGKPYRDFLANPAGFHGPGRNKEVVAEVTEVRIGVFGPTKGTLAEAGASLRKGTQMAIDQANAEGGYQGIPFRLVFRPDDGPWGTAARQMVKLAYEDKVWAVLGSVDGPNTHIAEQIATKAWVPLVAPTASDPTLTQINIPWIFCCMPNDQQQALALAEYVFRTKGYTKIAGLAINDDYGRLGMAEFAGLARRLGHPLYLELKYEHNQVDFSKHLDLIKRSDVEAIVIWGTPREASLFIHQLRSRGMTQAVLGGGALATPELLQAGSSDLNGTIVVLPYNPFRDDQITQNFRKNFRARYGCEPDFFAAYSYDGMRIIIRAIRVAGLNRVRIRDAIATMTGFEGVVGKIEFTPNGINLTTPVTLALIHNGNFSPICQFSP